MSGHKDRDSDHHLTRIANRERFRPLHAIAAELLDRAARRYDVGRIDAYGADARLEAGVTLARASVVLVPTHAMQAPIVVAFSAFPGLLVRFGSWCCQAFPACGCDACGETAEEEGRRFTWMAENLIAGRFRETLVRDGDTAWCEWESWDAGSRQRHRSALLTGESFTRLSRDGVEHQWQAWSLRR
jgi:hypothetical protein